MKKRINDLNRGEKFSFRRESGTVFMKVDDIGGECYVDLTGDEGEISLLSEFGDLSQEVYILEWSDLFN